MGCERGEHVHTIHMSVVLDQSYSVRVTASIERVSEMTMLCKRTMLFSLELNLMSKFLLSKRLLLIVTA